VPVLSAASARFTFRGIKASHRCSLMAKHHVIDYDSFLPRLVAGLRSAWQEVRRQRPDETFYTFGIETDSDLTDLYPLCNTEEEYEAQGGGPEPCVDKWIGCADEESELYRAGRRHTTPLAREVNRLVFEDHSQDPKGAFLERKKRLLKVFEQALAQLDQEGFFGSGKKRHKVLLKIEFVDASDAEWRNMLKVIKRINPPESTAEFFAALKREEKETPAQEAEEQLGHEPIKAQAIAFLHREKRAFDACWGARKVEEVTPFLLGILGEKEAPTELWEVNFDARNEPDGRLHGPGQLAVYVIPASGKCVIAP
jgi:hypothetical protein